jgi:uncharacterized membrane protein YccC
MSNATALIMAAILAVLIVAVASGLLAYTAARRASPDTLRQYEQVIADMQQRLERTEQRSDQQQEQIDRLRDALAAEQDYSRALARAMRDAGLEPPPRPEPPLTTAPNKARLGRMMVARFTVSEMRDLAAELDIDEYVGGDTRADYAGHLAEAAEQRGLLLRLVELCRRDRPHGGF